MTTLAQLVRKRANVKGQLTRILNFCKELSEKLDDKTDVEQFKIRLSRSHELLKDFTALDDEIVAAGDNNETDLPEFESAYYDVVSVLNAKIRSKGVVSTNDDSEALLLDSSVSHNSHSHSEFKLPRLNIPKFGGTYTEWQSFYDLFCSAIHTNANLTPAQKFQHLKGLLYGEAYSRIQNYKVTDLNYAEAFRQLVSRYDRKRLIVNSYIQEFIEQPVIKNCNAVSIRKLADKSEDVVRGLRALGNAYEGRDPWLVYLVANKLDEDSREQWLDKTAGEELPTFESLIEFLSQRADTLEGMKPTSSKPKVSPFSKPFKPTHTSSNTVSVQVCDLCTGENHFLNTCPKFAKLSIEDRRKHVRENRRCFNCMQSGHPVYKCRVRSNCFECKKRHHTMLHLKESNGSSEVSVHFAQPGSSSSVASSDIINQPEAPSLEVFPAAVSMSAGLSISNALLPTAIIKVRDGMGSIQLCRVLLDSGSQVSLISESCVKRLHLPRSNGRIMISGLAGQTASYSRGIVDVTAMSRFDDSRMIHLKALVLGNITSNTPSCTISMGNWTHIKNLELADPAFNEPEIIDLLIGADHFFTVLLPGSINVDGLPTIQNTIFGWVVAGNVRDDPIDLCSSTVMHTRVDVDEILQRFWKLEELPSKPIFTAEEELCENHFQRHTHHSEDGKLVVKLPTKSDVTPLGDSLRMAQKRLFALERKFQSNPEFKQRYLEFMKEYEDLGHMEEIVGTVSSAVKHPYYLPHHGVLKESSTTTKLRVVFDASAKSSSGTSLNDHLLVGPTIQPPLLSILQRFRFHKIVFCADIEKMYRMVWVAPEDRDYQRILWRPDVTMPIRHYRLKTVTYGTASAPFLAIRSLQFVAEKVRETNPEIASILETDFYVDDCMSGTNNLQKAIEIQRLLTQILSESGFHLRKWCSNDAQFMNILNESSSTNDSIAISDDSGTKILGLEWFPSEDVFRFKINLDSKPTMTKRSILSEAARIFDPLGWLAPSTILVKIFFQQLWLLKLEWDTKLPPEHLEKWLAIREGLIGLESVSIPRWLHIETEGIQLHGFSDASEMAYGAVVYCRVPVGPNKYRVTIMTSKTKVAPISQISVPRLELCGAALLAKLLAHTKDLFQSKVEIYAWTDSTIVLSWLSSIPRRWKTYVANRTAEILRLTSRSNWGYVPSQENPADLASRGVVPRELANRSLWWVGPSWLGLDDSHWPIQPTLLANDGQIQNEEKPSFIHSLHVKIPTSCLEKLCLRISSYSKICRMVAWILRLLYNAKSTNVKDKSKVLTPNEMKLAELTLCRWIQQTCFADDWLSLSRKGHVDKWSCLRTLNPFLDAHSIIRVGGRIQNAAIPFDVQHPIILPSNHPIITKYLRERHLQLHHANVTELMAIVRQRFWVIRGKNLIRTVVKSCVPCCRHNAVTQTQLMGSLPQARVTYDRPFLKVGIDFAGPMMLRLEKGRGGKTYKAWLAIFVCMSVKAVHIEVVNDLSSESFLAALRRFVSRRGVCTDIFTDNATNFVGTNRELKEVFEFLKVNTNSISNSLLSYNIRWHFIPSSAPNFGGLWEAAVKATKYHIKRVVGSTTFTREEMETLASEIEAILNSRPICAMSNDDIDALTPSHFLIGHPQTYIPDPDVRHLKINMMDRWQLVQSMVQNWCERWRSEYVTTLQKRNKWQHRNKNLQIGDLVIVQDQNLPPSKWLLGRVESVHPGTDKLVRAVMLRTANGQISRPVNKLCLLPVDSDVSRAAECSDDHQ